MALVIVLFVVVVLALVLYDQLRPALPKRFQLGDGGSPSALVQTLPKADVPATPATTPNRWLITSDGVNVRAVREFKAGPQGQGQTYAAPLLYFSCYQHTLYAWVDTRLAAAPSLRDPLHVEVQVNDQPVELWARQEGQTLAAPNPAHLLRQLEKKPALTLTLAYSEAPRQPVTLAADPTKALTAALAPCRK